MPLSARAPLPLARLRRLTGTALATAALAGLAVAASPGCAAAIAPQGARPSVQYLASFPSPEHHWMQVRATFRDVPAGTLELRMARSSPGRYALHEFAKNVFEVAAADGTGRPLVITRPNEHQWNVDGHDGTVVVTYRVFGDRADGTYLQVDTTHAHMNGPATWMWARGELSERPLQLVLEPPADADWSVATQLFPTDDPLVYTAPNLQYLMDSPVEFGEGRIYEFDADDGQTIRVALHHQGSDDEALQYLDGVRAIVHEAKGVFGEYPHYDGGTYTFIVDYLPWASGDGMEHRNSTVVSSSASLAVGVSRLLGTASHEFFHCWNVERIRPDSIEPFDFERANMSSELWLAEGFTSYYGNLILERAGLRTPQQALDTFGAYVSAVLTSPGTRFRSAVDMSRLAPFVDAANPGDPVYWDNTFLSYYTYGAAIAVGLDLTLRDRSDGNVTLDTFMRAMWERYGKPQAEEPPTIPHPYDVDGAREVLGEVAGDRDFADDFFARHVEGTEPIDYAPLLARAGLGLEAAAPGTPYTGIVFDEGEGGLAISSPTLTGSPGYEAGLDTGDTVVAVGDVRLTNLESLREISRVYRPGQTVNVRFRRRDGSEATTRLTFGQSPYVRVVPMPNATPEQLSFRNAWLASTR